MPTFSRRTLKRCGARLGAAQVIAELDELASLANTRRVTKVVNMHEAKSTLSKLVEEAEAGEEIILARAGQPVVRLVPVRAGKPRQLGQWKGRVRMADDFDAPLPDDVLAGFEGR